MEKSGYILSSVPQSSLIAPTKKVSDNSTKPQTLNISLRCNFMFVWVEFSISLIWLALGTKPTLVGFGKHQGLAQNVFSFPLKRLVLTPQE